MCALVMSPFLCDFLKKAINYIEVFYNDLTQYLDAYSTYTAPDF